MRALVLLAMLVAGPATQAQSEMQDAHVTADLRGIDYVGKGVARALRPGPGDAPDADRNWNALSLPFVVGPKGRIGILRDAAPGGGAKRDFDVKGAKDAK